VPPTSPAAYIAGRLQPLRCEARLAEAVQQIQAGKAGADHGDVDGLLPPIESEALASGVALLPSC
jgi:hypothetical protein